MVYGYNNGGFTGAAITPAQTSLVDQLRSQQEKDSTSPFGQAERPQAQSTQQNTYAFGPDPGPFTGQVSEREDRIPGTHIPMPEGGGGTNMPGWMHPYSQGYGQNLWTPPAQQQQISRNWQPMPVNFQSQYVPPPMQVPVSNPQRSPSLNEIALKGARPADLQTYMRALQNVGAGGNNNQMVSTPGAQQSTLPLLSSLAPSNGTSGRATYAGGFNAGQNQVSYNYGLSAGGGHASPYYMTNYYNQSLANSTLPRVSNGGNTWQPSLPPAQRVPELPPAQRIEPNQPGPVDRNYQIQPATGTSGRRRTLSEMAQAVEGGATQNPLPVIPETIQPSSPPPASSSPASSSPVAFGPYMPSSQTPPAQQVLPNVSAPSYPSTNNISPQLLDYLLNNYAPASSYAPAQGYSPAISNARYTPVSSNYLMMSDENVKTDIKPSDKQVEEFLDPLNPWIYQYKDKKHGEGTYISPMAQEFEKSELGKKGIIETKDGKMVDYSEFRKSGVELAALAMIHKRLKKLEEKK